MSSVKPVYELIDEPPPPPLLVPQLSPMPTSPFVLDEELEQPEQFEQPEATAAGAVVERTMRALLEADMKVDNQVCEYAFVSEKGEIGETTTAKTFRYECTTGINILLI